VAVVEGNCKLLVVVIVADIEPHLQVVVEVAEASFHIEIEGHWPSIESMAVVAVDVVFDWVLKSPFVAVAMLVLPLVM
jgi:hypothetical protein